MDLQDAQTWLTDVLEEMSVQFQKVPGSAIFLRYVKSSYQNDPIRSAVELFLFLFAVRYLLAPTYKPQNNSFVKLSDEEIDELVDDWTPEPLVASQTPFEEAENEKRPVIVGPTGPKSKLSNGRTVTNLASYNFYNLVANETLKEKAIQVLRTYGVGPCSPPGFYGTQDVHVKTEADIAAHLGAPACIVYAQAFSTISSVLPAFSKRGDIIVADRAVNYAARKGIQISRSSVYWYQHNDLDDMQRVLEKVVKEQARKPLTRRFIVTEGLSENVGDVVDLSRIIELKHRYKFRLILDETWSYGVLGRTGRGVTESQNVDAREVDMIIGSLAGPLCAGGGFCAGSEEIVEHQRISAAAYTYSAALPAMLATTASEVISMLQTTPDMLTPLRENIKTLWAQLDPRSEWMRCTSSVENPIMILIFKPEFVSSKKLDLEDQQQVLQDVIDEALANGIMITRVKSMPRGQYASAKDVGWELQPALKICVTSGLSKKEVERAGITIRHAITKVVKSRRFIKSCCPAYSGPVQNIALHIHRNCLNRFTDPLATTTIPVIGALEYEDTVLPVRSEAIATLLLASGPNCLPSPALYPNIHNANSCRNILHQRRTSPSSNASALVNYDDTGLSLAEISHRSPTSNKILADTKAALTSLLDVPENYEILVMHGGGSGVFSAIVLNMVAHRVERGRRAAVKDLGEGKRDEVLQMVRKEVREDLKCGYIVTGSWSLTASQGVTNLPDPLKEGVDSRQFVSIVADATEGNNGKFGTIQGPHSWKLYPSRRVLRV